MRVIRNSWGNKDKRVALIMIYYIRLKIFEAQTGWWRVEQTALAAIIPYGREPKWNIVGEYNNVSALNNE